MKKKLLLLIAAAVIVVASTAIFAACGDTPDIKELYQVVDGLSEGEKSVPMQADKLEDLDGADVTVSGNALISSTINPDTSETAYELWVNSPKEMSPLMTPVYSGDIKPKEVPYVYTWPSETADWCWVVDNAEAGTITIFTIDRGKEAIEYDAWSGAPSMYIERGSDGIETLFVDGEEYCEYDREKGVVTDRGAESNSGTPSLVGEGDMFELEEVDIEVLEYYWRDGNTTPKVVRVYDKQGNALRLVNLYNLIPDQNDNRDVVVTKKAVYIFKSDVVPDDAKDYDYYESGRKYKISQYKYDWKSGKVSEFNPGYYVFADEQVAPDADVYPMVIAAVEDNKVQLAQSLAYCDADMNIIFNIGEIVPGASEATMFGDYLKISNGTITKYFDSEGNLVGEYLRSLGTIEEDESGLLKKGNDWFTVSGEYLFTLGTEDAPDTKMHLASFPGKVYYAEMRLDEDGNPVLDETTEQPIADFKVYDVTSGTTATLWSTGDTVKFDLHGVYILCDEEGDCTVYDMKSGNRLTDFATDDPGSVYISAFGDDLLIEYTITHVENNVETSESRYIFVDTDPFSPEMNCTGPTEE